MPQTNLGRTLAIANPTSHSGRGASAADLVRTFFEYNAGATTNFDLERTRAVLDGVDIARAAGGMDTVIALGGDGLIHEVVNGLMAIDARDRPRLAIIPLGTGNDFARTLGMTANNPDRALSEILTGTPRTIDLGRVRSDVEPTGPSGLAGGTYFVETLSFGMDAAIALDTTDRRTEGTRQQGSSLFISSSIKIFSRSSAGYPCRASFDGEDPVELPSLMFAVQNGPTYGAGFRICPAATPTDGLLDVCYNVRRARVPHLLFLLALARRGHHTWSRVVNLRQVRSIELDFTEREPPCQVDGESLTGTHFDIEVAPKALEVIVSCRR